jgi:hypothetical protein
VIVIVIVDPGFAEGFRDRGGDRGPAAPDLLMGDPPPRGGVIAIENSSRFFGN